MPFFYSISTFSDRRVFAFVWMQTYRTFFFFSFEFCWIFVRFKLFSFIIRTRTSSAATSRFRPIWGIAWRRYIIGAVSGLRSNFCDGILPPLLAKIPNGAAAPLLLPRRETAFATKKGLLIVSTIPWASLWPLSQLFKYFFYLMKSHFRYPSQV